MITDLLAIAAVLVLGCIVLPLLVSALLSGRAQ